MVFTPTSSPGARSARQFRRLCLCRWTARKREPGTLSGSISGKNWKMFLKMGGFVVALDTERALETLYKPGLAGRLPTASERLNSVGTLDRRQGLEGCPGKP